MTKSGIFARTLIASAVTVGISGCSDDVAPNAPANPFAAGGYEVWAPDQSNSTAGQALGSDGSLLWIWDSADIETQVAGGATAVPTGCDAGKTAAAAPCDIKLLFPAALAEDAGTGGTVQEGGVDATVGLTGQTLGSQDVTMGRVHGMLGDPQNLYFNVNFFKGAAGYVGIMDARSREAIAMWRITKTDLGRSNHMSFWNADGSALLIANLHGRLLERIDIVRNSAGVITQANFNRNASLSSQGVAIVDDATTFTGANHNGNNLIGTVSGTYSAAAIAGITPNGNNKVDGTDVGVDVGRSSGVIICPIVADNGVAYITLAGGGALIADTEDTPMTIIGEYSNNDAVGGLNGVGCGGVQVGDTMWLNSGASATAAGATQSTFTMYHVPVSDFSAHAIIGSSAALNTPAATLAFKDANNTDSGGNTGGVAVGTGASATGQAPGTATRRDGHGATRTLSGSHIHMVDRVQNNVEVFSATGLGGVNAHVGSYDLTSADGQGTGTGACAAASVTDDVALPTNDPAPDLMATGPDGRFLFIANRGPNPVTVTHSAQGSCPGVTVVQLSQDGSTGSSVAILRTTNTTDDVAATGVVNGGVAYAGTERSDIHGVFARTKVLNTATGAFE